MTLSIIVPVYNAEPYLHRCIDSIITQDYEDYELLLIDDGSSDRSGKICNNYAKDKRSTLTNRSIYYTGYITNWNYMGIYRSMGSIFYTTISSCQIYFVSLVPACFVLGKTNSFLLSKNWNRIMHYSLSYFGLHRCILIS